MSGPALRGLLAAFSGGKARQAKGWAFRGPDEATPPPLWSSSDYADFVGGHPPSQRSRHRKRVPNVAFPENLFVARP
eukprot:3866114-Alexandrium_andersonii.AAC.1